MAKQCVHAPKSKEFFDSTANELERLSVGIGLNDLIKELRARENYWREAESDPHGIRNAVIASLAEVRTSLQILLDKQTQTKGKL